MIFQNREEAGLRLIPLLKKYQGDKQAIVIGLPRGGVVVANEVARGLNLPLDVIILRKVGAPFNPELALGAVSETGQKIFNQDLMDQLGIEEKDLTQEIERETKLAKKRYALYRGSKPTRNLLGKKVILVDDGLATGATMKVAIETAKKEGASRVIVAVPVAPFDTIQEIKFQVDEVICPEIPSYFEAVGQFYFDFRQVEDDEVLSILRK